MKMIDVSVMLAACTRANPNAYARRRRRDADNDVVELPVFVCVRTCDVRVCVYV